MSLKRIREARGLNPRELAELSGVHVVKIYQIEAEKIKPENIRLKNAVRLANALNCRCEDLLGDTEDQLGHWVNGYCDKCGGAGSAWMKFCPHCGSAMNSSDEKEGKG